METVVYDKPEVKLDAVESVGSDKIFFNWTVVDWNAPVTDYFLSVRYTILLLVVHHSQFTINDFGDFQTPFPPKASVSNPYALR